MLVAPLAKFGRCPTTVLEIAAGADQASALRAPAAVKLGAVGVHTEIAAPKITAIRVENATVTLTVEDLSPVADYFVMPSAKPGETAPVLDTAPDANGTFTFPKPEGAPFFKVIGVRKF